MMVCKGEGTLVIDPSGGNLQWVEKDTPQENSCRQAGYLDVEAVAGSLGFDIPMLPPPPCEECPRYEECNELFTAYGLQREDMGCFSIDEIAISPLILDKLGNVETWQRERLLSYSRFTGFRSPI